MKKEDREFVRKLVMRVKELGRSITPEDVSKKDGKRARLLMLKDKEEYKEIIIAETLLVKNEG